MSSSDCQEGVISSPLRVLAVSLQPSDLDDSFQTLFDNLCSRVLIDRVAELGSNPDNLGAEGYDLILWGSTNHVGSLSQVEFFRKTAGAGLVLLLGRDRNQVSNPTDTAEYENIWLVPREQAGNALHWALGQCIERRRLLKDEKQVETQLRDAALRMELADVASTVLHNVGNVLSSVNVAGKIIEELTTKSSVVLINRMSDLLKAHDQDWVPFLSHDPKGKKIVPLLIKLGNQLIDEQQAVLREIRGLLRHLTHVRSVIVSHQTMARAQGMVEPVSIEHLLDQALELSFQPADMRWLRVHRQFQGVPDVFVDKHQILQILVNLFRNAKQAMLQQGGSDHTFTLDTRTRSDGLRPCVEVSIRDTGIGIPSEHLGQMFIRGFTTKKNGNGIGLHSSLATLEKFGGTLSVWSEGIGTGATFTLTLPTDPEGIPK